MQYLCHDDLDKGIVEAIEVTQTVTDYTPMEYGLHAFVLFTSLYLQEYWLALYCLPMALYHLFRY